MRNSDHHNQSSEVFTFAGIGQPITCRCDECQRDGIGQRKRGKVKAGPLKGLFGMICQKCADKREKVSA